MHNKFPSAFSRRLLIAMWVSLCRSGITMDVLPDISSLTVRRAPEAQNGANSNAQAATERAVASASASSGVMSFHSAMDYLKGLLNHVSRILVPYESRKEADHFICYVCILLGDLCRYRDIHATKMLQKEVQEGTLLLLLLLLRCAVASSKLLPSRLLALQRLPAAERRTIR